MTVLTMDEIEETVLPLYYMQKINFETADEYTDECRPLWKRIPKEARIYDVLTEEERNDRATRNNTLYRRQWTGRPGETRFTMTSQLSPLLKPDCWPGFDVTTESPKKKAVIDAWMDLIPASAEARRIRATINETAKKISDTLNSVDPNSRAEEYRGWYVTISTSRRQDYGWVVGGRGNTIHILPDPLAGLRRISGVSGVEHNRKIPLSTAGDAVARQIVGGLHHLPTNPEANERYSLKTASVSLIYPPDMAIERRVWVNKVLVQSAVHLPEARVLSKAYTEWQETTSPIRMRRRQYESWINGIPTNIEDVWFSPDKPPSLWGSDSGGLREALLVLGAAAELDVPSLREAMIEKYLSLHPDQVLTEAEQTLLDATPPGADTVLVSLTGLLVEKVKQTLLPQF